MAFETPDPHTELRLVDHLVRRIANSRSLTLGLAATFLVIAVLGGILMRIVDQENFPTLGLAAWWTLQTITTVGYGDVVPTNAVGRVVGGIEMVIGVSFIAFLTSGLTSSLIQRRAMKTAEAHRAQGERNTQTIVEGLIETRKAIAALDERLDQIERGLAG
jgi:voltage-gated potassium channel